VVTCNDGAGICAAAAPEGWIGPVILYLGADPEPACPSSMRNSALHANADLGAADPAQCSCSCDVIGTTCTGSYTLQKFSEMGCASGTCGAPSQPMELGTCYSYIQVTCSQIDTAPVVAWYANINATSNASCSALDNSVVPPAPTWATTVLGCGSLSLGPGGCSAGDVCVDQPGSPFSQGACVFQRGDQPCPAGRYTERTLVFGGMDDTRACTSCSCNGPTGGSCQGSITMKSGAGCTGTTLGTGSVPGCVDKPLGSGYVIATANTVGATCQPNGGAPMGSVTPTEPTTVCCTP